MNQETEKSKELKFVCPACGANSLRAWASGHLDIDAEYDNGLFTWRDMTPEDIGGYQCRECGYELEFDEDEGIAGWLKTHCNQDESGVGHAQKENSEVPPADES